jgi:two-component system chemotaxis response regulator CheB
MSQLREVEPQSEIARPISVVICEDSPFMRRTLELVLAEDPGVDVVATTGSGEEAAKLCRQYQPDVLTLDLELPDVDGIEVLGMLGDIRTRVLVVSSATSTSTSDRAIEALSAGALDVLGKPSGSLGSSVFRLRLLQAVRDLGAGTGRHVQNAPAWADDFADDEYDDGMLPLPADRQLLVIGASTGGPAAVHALLAELPEDYATPIVVVQHLPSGFSEPFARRLQRSTSLNVIEAYDEAPLEPGTVLVAKAGQHMHVDVDCVWIRDGDPVHGMCPSVDVTLCDAATTWGAGVTAVILTGIGSDGCDGAREVRRRGGRVLAEHRSTCAVYGMPRAVVEAGVAHRALPLHDIAPLLIEEAA